MVPTSRDNGQRYWIQFTNGYTSAGWRFALNGLGDLAGDEPWNPVFMAHRSINDFVIMLTSAEDKVEATSYLNILIGITQGLTIAAEDTQVYQRIYQYMYDALSLAYVVEYEDRLDD